MAQAQIVFAPNSSPGERSQLSGTRLINAIVEKLGSGELLVKRAPGLKRKSTSAGGYLHCRGMIEANANTLLVLYNDYVESVVLSGGVPTHSVRGPLSGSDLVTLAKNNAATPDIVGVSPANGAFVLTTGGAPLPYPDADVGFPVSICFIDGYFFFVYGSGQCVASGLNTTAINPLDSILAESHAGGLVRGVGFNGQLYLFGPSFCEVWQNTANATGFPFSRSTVIQTGLASVNAVAGFESGFTSSLIWVSRANIVYQMNGYSPVRISTEDVEHDLQSLTDKSSLHCFVAMNNGHAFWVMKSKSFTWVFDLLTATWQERNSYQSLHWRGTCSVYAFGDWIIGDETNGNLYNADNLTYAEDGNPLIYDVTSQPVGKFPMRENVARMDIGVTPGTGRADGASAQIIDPKMWISWSDDGGAEYNRPVSRSIGQQGHYHQRIAVNRCGRTRAYGRQWNFKVSDPVYVGITTGVMQSVVSANF